MRRERLSRVKEEEEVRTSRACDRRAREDTGRVAGCPVVWYPPEVRTRRGNAVSRLGYKRSVRLFSPKQIFESATRRARARALSAVTKAVCSREKKWETRIYVSMYVCTWRVISRHARANAWLISYGRWWSRIGMPFDGSACPCLLTAALCADHYY